MGIEAAPEKFCFPAQTPAAKERKHLKNKRLYLGVLGVLWRPPSGVAASFEEIFQSVAPFSPKSRL